MARSRDEVVVVGVEPLGHFLRRHPRVAACQREVQVEAFAAAEALRDRPEQECDVQDLVVERWRVGQRGIRGPESEFNEARQVRSLRSWAWGIEQGGVVLCGSDQLVEKRHFFLYRRRFAPFGVHRIEIHHLRAPISLPGAAYIRQHRRGAG